MQERLISQSGVTAQNRFPWYIIITNLNTVYALRASVAEGGGGERESFLYFLAQRLYLYNLRKFLRKSSYDYKPWVQYYGTIHKPTHTPAAPRDQKALGCKHRNLQKRTQFAKNIEYQRNGFKCFDDYTPGTLYVLVSLYCINPRPSCWILDEPNNPSPSCWTLKNQTNQQISGKKQSRCPKSLDIIPV